MSPPAARYATASPDALVAPWGGYVSVFNPRTGETHLLSILPAEVLALLAERPLDLERIGERMATLCETQGSADWTDKMRGVLDELEHLELVDRLPG